MTFNRYISNYKINDGDIKQQIDNKLLIFTDNMIDLNTVNYSIYKYNYITGWDIDILDDYTFDVFYTDQKTLNRKLKIKKLINGF